MANKGNSPEHLARDCPYNNGESRSSSSDITQGANVHYSTQVEAYRVQDILLPLLEQSDEEYGPTFDDSGFPGETGILDVYESIYKI